MASGSTVHHQTPVPIYLVRHGVTGWNRDGLIQGWTDIPLSDLGRAQAERLAARLTGAPLARVVTSTLSRARETAEAIAGRHGLPVETYADLREYNCGEWEGQPFLQVRSADRERFLAWFNDPETPTPGGESMAAAGRRAVPVVHRMLGEMSASGAAGGLMLVGHGGVIRLIAADLMGVDLAVTKPMRLDNASITIFEPYSNGYSLKLWNGVAHLDGLPDREGGDIAARLG